MSQTLAQPVPRPVLDPELFAGVLAAIKPQSVLQEEDVKDDLNREGETLGSSVPGLILEDGNSDNNYAAMDGADLIRAVDAVSKGVSDRTHDEYRQYVLYPLSGSRLLLIHLLGL